VVEVRGAASEAKRARRTKPKQSAAPHNPPPAGTANARAWRGEKLTW